VSECKLAGADCLINEIVADMPLCIFEFKLGHQRKAGVVL
jgi:hypothetical protein